MWPNPQQTADLVKFTEETLMENFIFFMLWKMPLLYYNSIKNS